MTTHKILDRGPIEERVKLVMNLLDNHEWKIGGYPDRVYLVDPATGSTLDLPVDVMAYIEMQGLLLNPQPGRRLQ